MAKTLISLRNLEALPKSTNTTKYDIDQSNNEILGLNRNQISILKGFICQYITNEDV